MPQRLEKYCLNLLSFRLVCSKLQLLFLNANIKMSDVFDPTVCGLKATFSYINGSKFLRFLILLEIIFADQVLSAKFAKIKSREIKVLHRNSRLFAIPLVQT